MVKEESPAPEIKQESPEPGALLATIPVYPFQASAPPPPGPVPPSGRARRGAREYPEPRPTPTATSRVMPGHDVQPTPQDRPPRPPLPPSARMFAPRPLPTTTLALAHGPRGAVADPRAWANYMARSLPDTEPLQPLQPQRPTTGIAAGSRRPPGRALASVLAAPSRTHTSINRSWSNTSAPYLYVSPAGRASVIWPESPQQITQSEPYLYVSPAGRASIRFRERVRRNTQNASVRQPTGQSPRRSNLRFVQSAADLPTQSPTEGSNAKPGDEPGPSRSL